MELPRSDAVRPRPVWRRHLQRTKRSFEDMHAPTEAEKRDAIKVLADPNNEAVPGLWLEAHRILDDAGQ